MTRIIETILQPCLTPVTICTVPKRSTLRHDTYLSTAEKRDASVYQIIKNQPGIAQGRISLLINASDSTASKSLSRLVDAGRIELYTAANKSASSPKNFYQIKEVVH